MVKMNVPADAGAVDFTALPPITPGRRPSVMVARYAERRQLLQLNQRAIAEGRDQAIDPASYRRLKAKHYVLLTSYPYVNAHRRHYVRCEFIVSRAGKTVYLDLTEAEFALLRRVTVTESQEGLLP